MNEIFFLGGSGTSYRIDVDQIGPTLTSKTPPTPWRWPFSHPILLTFHLPKSSSAPLEFAILIWKSKTNMELDLRAKHICRLSLPNSTGDSRRMLVHRLTNQFFYQKIFLKKTIDGYPGSYGPGSYGWRNQLSAKSNHPSKHSATRRYSCYLLLKVRLIINKNICFMVKGFLE